VNINITDTIAKAKALVAFLKNSANGWYAKLRAVTDFVTYVLPFLPDPATVFAFSAVGGSTEDALAGLEGLGARRGAPPTNKECQECLVKFLVTITRLDCCE